MKKLAAAVFALSICSPCMAEVLLTDSYKVSIDVRCEEGTVSCDKVRYVGVNRKTGKSIRLTGRTLHTVCADGLTPCRFLGYSFRRGKLIYTVWEEGRLQVTKGNRTVLAESGVWE